MRRPDIAAWRRTIMAMDRRAVKPTPQLERWLVWSIRHAQDPRERYRATCLTDWFWESDRVTGVLVAGARDIEEHHLIRGNCLEGLAHRVYGEPRNRVEKKVHKVVLHTLRDPHPNVRFWACFAAGSLRMKSAQGRLRQLLDDDGLGCMGWTVGYEAGEALKNIQDQSGWDDDRVSPGVCPYPPLW